MAVSIQLAREAGEKKRTGAHFTPPELADFVARRILSYLEAPQGTLDVLDPACGDGELLRAFWCAMSEDQRQYVQLHGIEENLSAITIAEQRLSDLGAKSHFLHADFIDMGGALDWPSLFQSYFRNAGEISVLSKPQVIIANPPYVRTQLLGSDRAQALAERFSLRGRVDLYHVFLIAMAEVLAPQGLIGVITSNRFLTTRGGESLREALAARFDLLEIIDLGDTKIFSAAVLPAIIVARRRAVNSSSGNGQQGRFIRIYEAENGSRASSAIQASSILETVQHDRDGQYSVGQQFFDVTSGKLFIGATPREPWRMSTVDESQWTTRVEAAARFRIADVAKVRVGIKSTADSVFIRGDWETLPYAIRPEEELLRPLFTHHDADRWISRTPQRDLVRILYTHESVHGKRRVISLEKFPRAKRYLEMHRKVLEGRAYVTDAGRQWFELWVPQDPALWENPKIIFPDISVEPRFFFDDCGALVNGDCYWISLDASHRNLLYLIQGVANSRLARDYHDLAFNNRLYSGRRRYISQYIEKYPLPNPEGEEASSIIRLVKALLRCDVSEQCIPLERELDLAVERAFS